jgi:HlyD family secretion protein/adhesin transport system membrane fusion protein
LIAQEKEALEEEMEIREELVDQGLNSNIKFLALQRQYFQIEKDILERKLAHDEKASMLKRQISQLTSQHDMIPHEITRKQVRISEIRKNLKLQESKAREQALFELDTVTETVKTLRERYLRFKERFDSSTLKATIDGTIQSLKRAGPGAVITPGELLCNIVPKEAKVIGLIKIDNKDIGHVSEGQDVRLKLTSFDFSRYGSLPGTITSIDANSTLEPTDGTTYFWARVDITSAKPNEDRPPLPLINGMSLDADIITGNKTVMEYLLKPIYASTLEAMQER